MPKRACDVYTFQLSFHFAYHRWWLGVEGMFEFSRQSDVPGMLRLNFFLSKHQLLCLHLSSSTPPKKKKKSNFGLGLLLPNRQCPTNKFQQSIFLLGFYFASHPCWLGWVEEEEGKNVADWAVQWLKKKKKKKKTIAHIFGLWPFRHLIPPPPFPSRCFCLPFLGGEKKTTRSLQRSQEQ